MSSRRQARASLLARSASFGRRYRGRARLAPQPGTSLVRRRRRTIWAAVVAAALVAGTAIIIAPRLHGGPADHRAVGSSGWYPAGLPHQPGTYFGVFTPMAPDSYAGVTAFTAATGVRPGVVSYYSGWPERFKVKFADAAVRHHAVPLVQIDPTGASISAIAAGRYDAYLRSYAAAVRSFGAEIILSFGHEMNGSWYSWGYHHTSPAVFVAAWRHIVTIFHRMGADNVIWLWTVNVIGVIGGRGRIPAPNAWWPGSSYVNWVGIDGYYRKPSYTFASLFGPTIKAVRTLTLDPILIAETAAAPATGKAAKIANLFAGIRNYGLLGFIWFDTDKKCAWRLNSPGEFTAFRRGVQDARVP
jgi:hypothetical protein